VNIHTSRRDLGAYFLYSTTGYSHAAERTAKQKVNDQEVAKFLLSEIFWTVRRVRDNVERVHQTWEDRHVEEIL
jgi:hypothetical protein